MWRSQKYIFILTSSENLSPIMIKNRNFNVEKNDDVHDIDIEIYLNLSLETLVSKEDLLQ